MDRLFTRTCSARQASVLAQADGKCTQVRSSRVRIHQPTGRHPIELDSDTRYLAKIEILDDSLAAVGSVQEEAVAVVANLFSPYLD